MIQSLHSFLFIFEFLLGIVLHLGQPLSLLFTLLRIDESLAFEGLATRRRTRSLLRAILILLLAVVISLIGASLLEHLEEPFQLTFLLFLLLYRLLPCSRIRIRQLGWLLYQFRLIILL